MVCLPAEKHHANHFSCSCSSKGCFSSPEPQTEGYRRDSLHFFFFCCACMQIDVRVSACVYQNMWRLEAKSVSSSGELHFIGIERPEIHKLFFSELQGSACVCVPSCHTRMSYGCWSLLWHSKHSPHWATSSLQKQCHSHSSGHVIQSGDQQAWAPTLRGRLQEIPAALPPVIRAWDDESWLNAEDKKPWVDLNSSEGV